MVPNTHGMIIAPTRASSPCTLVSMAGVRAKAVSRKTIPKMASPVGEQHTPVADTIRQSAHGHQQSRHQQRIDIDDPQYLGSGCTEDLGQRRYGNVQYGHVDDYRQEGQEDQPAALSVRKHGVAPP